MPPPSSSLSIVCDHIRDFIRTGIDGITNSIEVSIGSPAGVTSDDSHLLNCFFTGSSHRASKRGRNRTMPGGFACSA